jgi:hypothetical protein
VLFAVMTKIFAISQGLLPQDKRMTRLFEIVNLERGLIAGAILMLVGLAFLAIAVVEWYGRHFGNLDYERTMRWVIPGVTLTALGFQTVLSSFFFSILGLRRR